MLYKKTKFYTLGDAGSTPPATEPITPPVVPPVQTDAEKNNAEMRKTNEKLQKQLDAMLKAKSEAENAKLLEQGELQKLVDKLTAEKEELASKYSTTTKQSQVQTELLAAGLTQKQVELLTPSLMSQVQFGDDNQATNLAEVINNTKTNFPQLFTAPPAMPAGTSTGVSATTSASTPMAMTKEEAQKIMASGDANLINKNAEAMTQLASQF